MKNFTTLALAFCLVLISQMSLAQNVAINRDGSTPNPAAMLDLSATDAGLLIPRMTAAQKDAISSPPAGLLIYQTDNTSGFKYYTGTSWMPIASNSNSETITFNKDRSEPYMKIDQSSYIELASFIFRGTSVMGTPSAVKAVSNSEDETKPYSIMVYDATNSNIIVELNGISGDTLEINDLGTLSNLPSGEAIFQIMGKKDLDKAAFLKSISIQY